MSFTSAEIDSGTVGLKYGATDIMKIKNGLERTEKSNNWAGSLKM